MSAPLLVSVIDDDPSVRESLPDLLGEMGFAVRAFASAEEFLASACIELTDCLLLDITLPGISGPKLQRELSDRGEVVPIVFITANTSESVRSRVMADGASDCLLKPFSDAQLQGALNAALGLTG